MTDPNSLLKEKLTATLIAARKTRTLYVREEDQPIWDKAKELIGDSLSSYLTNHLKTFVAAREAATRGYERIVLNFREGGIPVSKAFHGRWLISPEKPYTWSEREGPTSFAVAITPKENIVVFRFGLEDFESPNPLGELGTHRVTWGGLDVYSSFEEANLNTSGDVIAVAMERLGVVVQELDI